MAKIVQILQLANQIYILYKQGEKMIKAVLNIKDKINMTPQHIYIGRKNKYYNLEESILHNPFRTGTKLEKIKKFENYFLNRFSQDEGFREYIYEIAKKSIKEDIYLVCWCKPEDCHGDFLKNFIDNISFESGQ